MTIKDYQDIVKKNDNATFWQSQDEDYKKDPGKYTKYQDCIQLGKKAAKNHLEKCVNPANEEAYAQWKTQFNSDPENVVKNFTDLIVSSAGAKELICKNASYESRIKNQFTDKQGNVRSFQPTTLEDAQVIEHFKNTMSAKHEAVGYTGDKEAVDEFWKNYTISQMQ